MEQNLAVIGAGSWGTALTFYLARKGLKVDLWVKEEEVYHQIRDKNENLMYLPGVNLPESVNVSMDMEETARGKKVILLVVPSHVMREVVSRMAGSLESGVILISAAKGIENGTLMTMSQVLEDVLPTDLTAYKACLSGPTFARELGSGKPSAVTLACADRKASMKLQNMLSSPSMRVYASQDLVGVELGGSLKNIYALGAGIADGLGLGSNARAALITRGLAEMSRLGLKMGANPLTFMGLAGLGDLVLTCTGDLSRNRTVGLKLGKGLKLKEILAEMNMVAEGVKTTKSVHDLTRKESVEMPLAEQVYKVLYEDKDPKQALFDLMTRNLKFEIDTELAMC